MFKKRETSLKNIEEKLDEIINDITEEKIRRLKWEDNKEKYLFDTLDAKGKLETEKAKLLKENANLKENISAKEKANEEQAKKIISYKGTVKNLTNEINELINYKNERESLIKDKEKLEKDLQKLKDEGMVLPKRVRKTGVTKDTKQVVGIKPSKVSGATKTELKKINELREKEAV